MSGISAQIIAFPAAPRRPDRLTAALAGMGEALALQRTAVAEWRRALSDLAGQVRNTEASLLAQRDALGGLRDKVTHLHDQALALQATAEAGERRYSATGETVLLGGGAASPATAPNATA